jgi:hypothetical protein
MIHTVASRPGRIAVDELVVVLSGERHHACRNAALNSVVEVVQMPPPNAP